MSLQDKIKKIINVINETNINEIEITSFWGAQKIRLSKSVTSKNQEKVVKENIKEVLVENPASPPITEPENKTIIENNVSEKPEIKNDIDEEKLENESETIYSEDDLTFQKAPLVGTFYASSKPGEPPFIKEGDEVIKGQTLCIIEAMKIFNEIESDFDGTIVEILIDDQSPVEFNQPIFSIKEK